MITGIFGEEFKNNKGNLKTYFMSWNLYLDYLNKREIYSNYKLNFSFKYIHSFKEMLKILGSSSDVSIGIDEMGIYLDAYMSISSKTGTRFLKDFVRQTRKRFIKMYYTAQTFADVHKSLRRVTDKIYITKKFHVNGNECFNEFCYDRHFILVYEIKTGIRKMYAVNPNIFELYNSEEIIELE